MANQSYDPSWRESWKTQGVRAAEARMAAVEEQANKTLAEARELNKQTPQKQSMSDADLREIEKAAKAPDASRELRKLQKRVDNGDFTWRELTEGKHLDDPDVRAAMESNLRKMGEMYAKFEAGYDLDEVKESLRTSGKDSQPTVDRFGTIGGSR